jgi:serine/threonine protein kinase
MRLLPSFHSSFEKQEFINQGGESTVWKGIIKEKVFDDIKLLYPLPLDRIVIRKKYKHPQEHERVILEILDGFEYIIRMYGYSLDKKCIYVEVCETDLYEWIMKKEQAVSTALFWNIVEQLLCAIRTCHQNNIVHGDIKLENIGIKHVQKEEQDTLDIRLFDFGQAVFVSPFDKNFETVQLQGSLHYTAPEVISTNTLDREYIFGIDYWELGVVCYSLLMRCFPFNGNTSPDVRKRIQKQTTLVWDKNVNQGCKLFTEALLTKHPDLRWTADYPQAIDLSSFKNASQD